MIHKYYLNGFYIVLDVHSGSVSVVDEAAYKLLDYITPPMAESCPEEALAALEAQFGRESLIETLRRTLPDV